MIFQAKLIFQDTLGGKLLNPMVTKKMGAMDLSERSIIE